MRKPSSLISWTQPEPDGGQSAGEGRQGSINADTRIAGDFSGYQPNAVKPHRQRDRQRHRGDAKQRQFVGGLPHRQSRRQFLRTCDMRHRSPASYELGILRTRDTGGGCAERPKCMKYSGRTAPPSPGGPLGWELSPGGAWPRLRGLSFIAPRALPGAARGYCRSGRNSYADRAPFRVLFARRD